MTRKLAVAVVGLGAVWMGLGATPPGPVETTAAQHVSFAAGGTIRLHDLTGEIVVEGWDKPEVELDDTLSLGFDSESAAKANARIRAVHVQADKKSDTEVDITTAQPGEPNRFLHPVARIKNKRVGTDYRIHVPRNSHLIFEHTKGEISVSGVSGDIEANDSRGDIILLVPELASYSIDATTGLGVVSADVAGAMHRKRLAGEHFTTAEGTHQHKLTLRMGFGGITIKDDPTEALTPIVAQR